MREEPDDGLELPLVAAWMGSEAKPCRENREGIKEDHAEALFVLPSS